MLLGESADLVYHLTVLLHAGYREYMRGGQWLLLLLGPATVAFALPIYEHRQLLRRHWPTLIVGVGFGCLLAFALLARLFEMAHRGEHAGGQHRR